MQRNLCAIILAAGLVPAAAPAFGQARIIQGGNAGTATIQQSGDNLAGALISQGVSGGGAIGNTANVLQVLIRDSEVNTISQEGNGNQATLRERTSDVLHSTIVQQGNGNLAYVDQSDTVGTSRLGPPSVTVNQQGDGNQGYATQGHVINSIVNLNQVGSDNYSSIFQHDGSNMRVDMNMRGDRNAAQVEQSASQIDFGNETVQADQTGSNNVLDVTQHSLGGFNKIVVTQAGGFNIASVNQFGSGLDASIVQLASGSENRATIIQN